MLIFVPATDLSTSAHVASSVTSLDLGFIKATGSKQISFRIGNLGSETANVSLSIKDLMDTQVHEKVSLSLTSFSISPGEISNTVTLTVSLPRETIGMSHILTVTASSGEMLEIYAEYVGPNTERKPQYPDRTGDATRVASDVVFRLGDTLTLFRFTPVAYDQSDTRRIINDKVITFPSGQGGCGDPCSRLNPSDPLGRGYTLTTENIIAQFQAESRTIRQSFQATDTTLIYEVNGRLILPSEFELTREWALFAFESRDGLDPDRYKRTVFIVKRQGELFAIENIRTLDHADDLSHFECDLIALHSRKMGDRNFYCPFNIVYLWGSDEPYSKYPCPCNVPEELMLDTSGGSSGGSLFSNSSLTANQSSWANPSTSMPMEEKPEPDPVPQPPIPVSATYEPSATRIIVNFDKELNEDNPINKTNWEACQGSVFISFDGAGEAIGSSVIFDSLSLSAGACDEMDITYNGLDANLKSLDGDIPVNFFIGFPLTII